MHTNIQIILSTIKHNHVNQDKYRHKHNSQNVYSLDWLAFIVIALFAATSFIVSFYLIHSSLQ